MLLQVQGASRAVDRYRYCPVSIHFRIVGPPPSTAKQINPTTQSLTITPLTGPRVAIKSNNRENGVLMQHWTGIRDFFLMLFLNGALPELGQGAADFGSVPGASGVPPGREQTAVALLREPSVNE